MSKWQNARLKCEMYIFTYWVKYMMFSFSRELQMCVILQSLLYNPYYNGNATDWAKDPDQDIAWLLAMLKWKKWLKIMQVVTQLIEIDTLILLLVCFLYC